MPESLVFFDATTAGAVFKSAWGIAGRAINAAVRGKVRVK